MLKQTLYFRTPSSLSLKDNQLMIRVSSSDDVITRPIEDIGVIIIENQQLKITIPLMNFLVEKNVALILCDKNCMPRSMLMNVNGNTTLQEAYKAQIEAKQPMKKHIWQQLIVAKIKNQCRLLNKLGLEGDALKHFYCNVKSGDTDNREGAAARIYWPMLFGSNFVRDRNGMQPNDMLNYGYTILRAAVARALISSGLYPAFGVFHRNRYNAFPLADDVMEPYRPFVDEVVKKILNTGETELTTEVKMTLQRILFSDVDMGTCTRPLEVALSITSASLLRYYKRESSTLSLPILRV